MPSVNTIMKNIFGLEGMMALRIIYSDSCIKKYFYMFLTHKHYVHVINIVEKWQLSSNILLFKVRQDVHVYGKN